MCVRASSIALLGALAGILLEGAAVAGERYALLVGVRSYETEQLKPLPYSESDVVELSQALVAGGYRADNVVLMTQTVGAQNTRFLPTASRIRKELDRLLVGREAEDTVVVAFAGHGIQFKGEAGSYFCPVDADLEDKATLLPIQDVYKALEVCPAGAKVLLVDACRNDPVAVAARSRQVLDLESVTRPQVIAPPGGVAAFFSCSAGERAFEHQDLKHGVFFHFVITALRGEADFDKDRSVSLEEVSLFTKRQVLDFVRAKLGQKQIPERIGQERGLLPLVDLGPILTGADPQQPTLGVVVTTATHHIVRGLGLDPRVRGSLVEDVIPGGPADRAGLKVNDIIAAVDSLLVRDEKALAAALKRGDPAREVGLVYVRGGFAHQTRAFLTPASTLIRERLRTRPTDAAGFIRRARAFKALGEPDAAIADLAEAVQLDPNNGPAHRELGRLHSGRNETELALKDFSEAIRIDPRDVEAYIDRAARHRYPGAMANYDAAIADYTTAAGLAPDRVDILFGRALVYSYDKKDYAAAIADFDAAIRLDPNYAVSYWKRAETRRDQGDVAGAFIDYDQAIRLDPQDPEAHSRRASVRRSKEDLDGAIADYTEAIRLDPTYRFAYIARASLREQKGDLAGAIADLTTVIPLWPELSRTHYRRRGSLREKVGDLDGAIADYSEAIRLNPNPSSLSFWSRGKARKAKGDLDGAITDFTEAIRLDPKDAWPYVDRAAARESKGDLVGAFDDLIEASRKAQDDTRKSFFRFHLEEFYRERGVPAQIQGAPQAVRQFLSGGLR